MGGIRAWVLKRPGPRLPPFSDLVVQQFWRARRPRAIAATGNGSQIKIEAQAGTRATVERLSVQRAHCLVPLEVLKI